MSPSYNHAAITMIIGTEINKTRKFRAFSELTLLIDGKEHIPDISVYKWRKIDITRDIKKMEELPLMAIEILSPTQAVEDLIGKSEIYLNAGIKSVWIVQPFSHTISICTKDGIKLFHHDEIVDKTGVKANLAIIFDDEEL
ncbi:Uma2 family endonuclease [Desulfobacterales bacterium HSG17]|nr:Uma2 family endonuclease [Desulfobacterales bacterium HSG17]